ncbi:AbrB/MazE/SpoVT family DNA-binding domain-containing protein [Clostridium cochlearium]|uniref:AbrB family transcriptional regulator n=1 Tax=Clostridium cochlearium TaxID=1494 RepID=A0A239ZJY4_CLOCO|nr:AbrB/MazE/SpoVT family DNA-binding domain-containing protein [Clostridium cochlearium]MBV1820658.1 AbrB/MazE/SpoVT family DNA-binding domain-containing protein [Bacteroidales bacterium MSK.15.36]NSJ92163.1 AbrB/MazE/SpoVT family DNA-binding domain-containing protein [Coprococcus sp. MSK.21.13]MBE6063943.1 AbrB/MazE/SpoVT family DNA-binding domain-containing protein [Clostridium cochlearium]MBU5269098.1 AbrB/MazE/SpoVT family DNA-binding domain-containing protein [Clostridium cochlearium]MCG
MKSTGIVRKVDELGRIVIPIELRRNLDIEIKDSLEIFVDGEHIILKKYNPSCIFCGNAKDVVHYKNKNICQGCLDELKSDNK